MVVCNLHQKWACFNIYIESEYFRTFPIFIDLMQKKKRERDGYEMYKCEFMQMYKSICILQWSELFFQCCFCGCSIFYWRRKRTWTTWVLLFTQKFPTEKKHHRLRTTTENPNIRFYGYNQMSLIVPKSLMQHFFL